MLISRPTKFTYALRAILDLALREPSSPVKTQRIASAQAVPHRFLEIILSELRKGGFVESRRGNDGGYFLARPPEAITLGQVIRFLEGHKQSHSPASHQGNLARDQSLIPVWKRVNDAVFDILDETTFADLAREELARRKQYVPDYAI